MTTLIQIVHDEGSIDALDQPPTPLQYNFDYDTNTLEIYIDKKPSTNLMLNKYLNRFFTNFSAEWVYRVEHIEFLEPIVAGDDMSNIFVDLKNLRSITGFEKIDTSNTTNMKRLFYQSYKLEYVDLSNINTACVTNMSQMFCECQSLTEINLSKFVTDRVKNFDYMFASCINVKKLDLSTFNTECATAMAGMFAYCRKLTQIDITNFNTEKISVFTAMFRQCDHLRTIHLPKIYCRESTWFTAMFRGCKYLHNINLENIYLSNHNHTYKHMFYGCNMLKQSTFNLPSDATNTEGMFINCPAGANYI